MSPVVPTGPAAPAVASGRPARPARLLAVEDNAANQLVLLGFLRSLGHDADLAASGAEALARLADDRYDAVLLDIEMPGMSGEEVLVRLRAGGPGIARPDLPVVMVTAHALDSVRQRCFRLGANDFLPKPLRRPDLAAAIARCTGRREEAAPGPAPAAAPGPAAPGPAASPPVFDRAGALERLGDAAVLALVVDAFLAEAPRYIAAIDAAAAAAEPDAVRRAAHALKGAAAAAGACAVQALAAALERDAQAGALAGARERAVRLSAAFESVREAARR